MGVEQGWKAIHHLLFVSHLINEYSGGSCSTQPLLCLWSINWWSVNWWLDKFFSHDPTRDPSLVSIQSHQKINLGKVLWLTVRLCKILGDGSGRYFRTLRTLFHSTKVKTNHLIIRVGNPDEWCTQNSLPQDCLPVGIFEVGNPEGNHKWGSWLGTVGSSSGRHRP